MWHRLDVVDLMETSNNRRIYLRVNAKYNEILCFHARIDP